jgi:hypothetical protein
MALSDLNFITYIPAPAIPVISIATIAIFNDPNIILLPEF